MSTDPHLPTSRTLTRRAMMQRSLAVTGGLLLPDWALRDRAIPRPTARSVIQIWLWGGPSHLDTFDPKPEAGQDYCGPLSKPVATPVDGLRLCELLPTLAAQAERYAVLRGVTHGVNAHETAAYIVQTGRAPEDRLVYPSAGAVASLYKGRAAGYEGLIPPYVVLCQAQGRFSESGFLGNRCKPFVTGGDPARTPFLVEGVVAPGISEERQRRRRQLLHELDGLARVRAGDPRIAAFGRCEDEAYELILGDAGKVFDLGQEKVELRERYGRSTLGQSCLLARRLVEQGVPWITINSRGWDTHKQHFQAMRRRLPELDRGLSALLADLADRGLLDTTIVWCGGEFGRSPKVAWEPPWNGGRGHYGKVFSVLLAGGGLRGGVVVGASDERGLEVAERPIAPRDVLEVIYARLGIDVAAGLPHPDGTTLPILPPAARGPGSDGPLVELV